MHANQSRVRIILLTALGVLVLGATACSPPGTPAAVTGGISPAERSIKVYESPT